MQSARLAFTTENASRRRWTPHKAWLRIRPAWQDAKHVSEVDLGIELVHPRRGDEGEQVAGSLAVVVAADK
jgi:hypothetical protein